MLHKKHLCVCVASRFSYFQLSGYPWSVAHKVPLFMGFSRQESWSRMPCPPPRYPPDPGIESMSLMFSALAGVFYTTSTTWKAQEITSMAQKKKKKARDFKCGGLKICTSRKQPMDTFICLCKLASASIFPRPGQSVV